MAASIDPGTPSSRATSATPRKMGAQQYYPGFSPPRDSPSRHVRSLKFGSREGRASERHPTRRGIDGRTSGKLSDSDEERPPVMVRSRTGTGFNVTSLATEKESSPRLTFRREYGSHGSIDMLTTGSERDNFYAFLREFGSNSSQDERSWESSHDSRSRDKLARSLQPFSIANPVTVRSENVVDEVPCPPSPKPKSKFKFFDGKGSKKIKVKDVTSVTSRSTSEPSIFKKLRPGSKVGAGCIPLSSVNSVETKGFSVLSGYDSDVESRLEDKLRRKAFGHHDCQSLAANLSYVAQLRSILSQRRNTTTGASAASQSNKGLTSPQDINGSENNNEVSPIVEHKDPGDGKSGPIVLSCPYFRNEFGGEAEWSIPLTRVNLERLCKNKRRSIASSPSKSTSVSSEVLLRPTCTYGLSILEFPPENTHWIHGICPYQKQPITVESIDAGALYYRSYFYGQEHQNWFGMDENLGPVAISLKREKTTEEVTNRNADCNGQQNQSSRHLYRLIIRTSELFTMRGTILEDAIPALRSGNGSKDKGSQPKEVLEFVAPEVQLSCLRLGTPGQTTEDQLLKLDHQGLSNHYKVGILYCKAGQFTEEEMYNNEDGSASFNEFLDLIGQKVRLKGFDKYKAGLDNKMDSTGQYSIYAEHQGCEIMFHVSTLLPFTPNNRQQLLRKRHIGNDIVTIVFQEPGARPFTPKNIRSQFQHVFVVVRAINPESEVTKYTVAVTRSREVPAFGPPLPEGSIFPKSKQFVDFLLAKVINAENAAHRSEKFATMATRTRQEYLKDLATNFVTSQTLDLGSKFPVLTFTSRKKERLKPRFLPETAQRGAIVWQACIEDSGHERIVDCLLGISADTLVVVEECTKEPIFCLPCKTVLGWTTSTNSARIYFHRGESITVHIRDVEADEIPEIAARLAVVTNGVETRELTLKRNSLGQLGFHVHPDGNVTEVECRGAAWKAGLRPGARIVEICKIAVSTLSHEQMVDLLKTSVTVTITVIPNMEDGTSRKGCNLSTCPYIQLEEGDYENLNGNGIDSASVPPNIKRGDGMHQVPQQQKATTRRWERSISPPRSSSSSGYGTGSSSRSYQKRLLVSPFTDPTGTLTSTSTELSNEDRWFDFESEQTPDGSPPPPLPIRNKNEMVKCGQSLKLSNNYVNHIYGEIQNDCQEIHRSDVEPEVMSKKCIPDSSIPFEGKMKASRSQEAIFRNGPLEVKEMGPFRPLQPPEYNVAIHERIATMKANGVTPSNSDPMAPESILDRLSASRSEDELSSGSNGLSPRSRRRLRNGLSSLSHNVGCPSVTPTPSLSSNGSGGGRNESPRGTAEARLRPAAAVRSGGVSSRKSTQGTSGNLQADLLRLIDPEYRTESSWNDTGYSKESNEPISLLSVQSTPSSQYRRTPGKDVNGSYGGLKLRPGERVSYALPLRPVPPNQNPILSRKARTMPPNMSPKMFADVKDILNTTGESLDSDGDDIGSGPNESVILTHARPATVISNASSSPSLNDSNQSRESGCSPRTNRHFGSTTGSATSSPPVPLPPQQGDDWSVLVNTARSIQGRIRLERKGNEQLSSMDRIAGLNPEVEIDDENAVSPISDLSAGSGFEVEKQVSELRTHVNCLVSRLRNEEVRRTTLEDQVKRLKDENKRLQVESLSASEQLKKFADWFFQAVEKP